MRWDVVGLVLGWTIRLIAIPLLLVFLYSGFVENEGLEYAAITTNNRAVTSPSSRKF